MFYFGELLLKRHSPLGLCLLASTITAGCGDLSVSHVYVHFSDRDAPNGPVPQVLTIGDEAQLVGHANANTSIPYVKYRSDKHPGRFDWKSSNPAVLRIRGDGGLSALSLGAAEITATVEGVDSTPLRLEVMPDGVVALAISPSAAKAGISELIQLNVVALSATGATVPNVPVSVEGRGGAQGYRCLASESASPRGLREWERTPCQVRIAERSPGTIILTARIPWVLHQADQITAEATVVVVE